MTYNQDTYHRLERGKPATPGAGFRLVATDLDGTLLRPGGTISERSRHTLAAVVAAGITVVLVTGRPPRSVRGMAQDAGVQGLAICCNGAIIYDLDQEAVVQHSPMSIEVATRLIADIRRAVPGVCFALEFGLTFGWEPAFGTIGAVEADPARLQGDALDLCTAPVTKLIVRHAEMSRDALFEITRQVAGDAASVTFSGAPFIEVSAAGIHKASALADLCARRGIAASQVIAFGDMPNDLPMLQWAGHSVAVANAHPKVRALADEITASNAEDGVALVLERRLLR
ncbi:MAG: HAD family phosphatase [Chloroflexi bacterium]|nr:HAD family phosphatase [Chloroflexota bacterium]